MPSLPNKRLSKLRIYAVDEFLPTSIDLPMEDNPNNIWYYDMGEKLTKTYQVKITQRVKSAIESLPLEKRQVLSNAVRKLLEHAVR